MEILITNLEGAEHSYGIYSVRLSGFVRTNQIQFRTHKTIDLRPFSISNTSIQITAKMLLEAGKYSFEKLVSEIAKDMRVNEEDLRIAMLDANSKGLLGLYYNPCPYLKESIDMIFLRVNLANPERLTQDFLSLGGFLF